MAESIEKHSTLSPARLIEVLPRLIENQISTIICGPPGIGKTSIPVELTKSLKRRLLISHPVTDDPVDYKGLPMVIDGKAEFVPIGTLADLLASVDTPTTWIIDDLGQAPGAVQAALMQLVGAGHLNGQTIQNGNLGIVCTTNRRQDKAAVTGLITPLRDRAVVLHLAADVPTWRKWAAKNDVHHSVVGFLNFAPQCLSKPNPTLDMEQGCSPRGWERVSKLVKLFGANHGELLELIEGCVGQGPAAEYKGFLDIGHSLPTVKEILAGPDKVPVPEKAMSRYALVSALAFSATKTNFKKILTYVGRMPDEYVMVTIQMSGERVPSLLRDDKSVEKWIYDHRDLFT